MKIKTKQKNAQNNRWHAEIQSAEICFVVKCVLMPTRTFMTSTLLFLVLVSATICMKTHFLTKLCWKKSAIFITQTQPNISKIFRSPRIKTSRTVLFPLNDNSFKNLFRLNYVELIFIFIPADGHKSNQIENLKSFSRNFGINFNKLNWFLLFWINSFFRLKNYCFLMLKNETENVSNHQLCTMKYVYQMFEPIFIIIIITHNACTFKKEFMFNVHSVLLAQNTCSYHKKVWGSNPCRTHRT